MDQTESSSPPPALPARPVDSTTKNESDQAKRTQFYIYGAAAGSVILGIALTSPKLFLGFLLGAATAAACIIGGVYYLLNIGVESAASDKQKEIEKKLDQPQLEGKVRVLIFCIFRVH